MSTVARWIPASDRAAWHQALAGIEYGPTLLPEYSAAAALVTGHEPGLWSYQGDDGRAACAIGRRQAPGHRFDLVTPLGFGGFAMDGPVPGLVPGWSEFWRAQSALAAYVQLSPGLDAAQWRARLPGFLPCLRESRECWLWDLAPPGADLAMGMSSKHRQLLHRWQRESAQLCWDRDELEPAFNRLYAGFIERREVAAAYRYPPAAISLLSGLAGTVWVGARGAGGQVEAVTIFLSHGDRADSFLNAASPEGRRHSRGLYWMGAMRLRERGVRWLNLGGGLVDGDALAQFKRRLGAKPVRTLALAQVIDAEGYARACAQAGVPAQDPARFPPWLGASA